MHKHIVEKVEVIVQILKDDGVFPNSKFPVILYKKVINNVDEPDPASVYEEIFKENEWENSWRNGIFDYHHYHSVTHEVLGCYKGTATVQLGGPEGIKLEFNVGDVLIIPAGVAHKNLSSSMDFKCVGSYPDGKSYDINYGKESERPKTDINISKVPIPVFDPVFGRKGMLLEKWK